MNTRPRKRGIREDSVAVFNPLPDVSDAELLQRAELDMMEPKDRRPFSLEWSYAGGFEKEYIELKPGKRHIMRRSDAQTMHRELQEQGLVIHELEAPVEEVKTLVLQALARAQQFWSQRGGQRLIDVRKKTGATKEEMDELRHEHFAFYYNQARADVLREKIEELRGEKKASTKAA